MTKSRVALIVVLVFCNVGFISSQQVEAAFRSSGIVKDVLDRAPSDLLQVRDLKRDSGATFRYIFKLNLPPGDL